MIWKVHRGNIQSRVDIPRPSSAAIFNCSIGWGDKGLPSNGPELPPHLVQVDALEVAFGDSNNIWHVITKGKLSKVGQGLLIADCYINQLDGDAGAITLAAALRMMMQTHRVPAGSC